MKSLPQRSVPGPIVAEDLGGGLWQLTAAGPQAAQVFLKLAPEAPCAALADAAIERLDLQWHLAGVSVRVTVGNEVAVFETSTVIVHEAKDHLYDALPLARLDTKARRFWQRVFLLIRMPGGRYLLRLIARHRR